MDFKVAYTKDKTKIPQALSSGVIDSGDMVLVRDPNINKGELVIISQDLEQIEISSSTRNFDSLATANTWLSGMTNPPYGELITVNVNGQYLSYTINRDTGGNPKLEPSATGGESSGSWVDL